MSVNSDHKHGDMVYFIEPPDEYGSTGHGNGIYYGEYRDKYETLSNGARYRDRGFNILAPEATAQRWPSFGSRFFIILPKEMYDVLKPCYLSSLGYYNFINYLVKSGYMTGSDYSKWKPYYEDTYKMQTYYAKGYKLHENASSQFNYLCDWSEETGLVEHKPSLTETSFNQGYTEINDGDNVFFIEAGDAFGNTGFGKGIFYGKLKKDIIELSNGKQFERGQFYFDAPKLSSDRWESFYSPGYTILPPTMYHSIKPCYLTYTGHCNLVKYLQKTVEATYDNGLKFAYTKCCPKNNMDENTNTYYSQGIKLNDGHGTEFTYLCDWTEKNGLVERVVKPMNFDIDTVIINKKTGIINSC